MLMKQLKLVTATLTLSAALMGSALAGAFILPSATGIGGTLAVPVHSITESKFDGVIKQYHDFSCGSAAVATLLTYHYENSVDEEEVFTYMWERGDKKKIESLGFSMLDMKKYLKHLGFRADGFRISLDKFKKYNVPGIALINTQGYQHFVVVKGIKDDVVLLGDPALGKRTMSREQFKKEWAGIFFLVRNHANVGRYYFNQEEEWGNLASAPLQEGINRDLSDLSEFTLSLPQAGDF